MLYITERAVFQLTEKEFESLRFHFETSNEKINNNAGENIAPYKNAIYINNPVDNYAKVINVNGRTVKKIKKSTINSVKYNKKSDTVIIITRRVKDNNNLYGLYIAK